MAGANAATVQTLIVDPALKVRIDISVSSVFGEACSRIDHVELDPNDLEGKNNVTIIVDPQCITNDEARVVRYTYDKMYY